MLNELLMRCLHDLLMSCCVCITGMLCVTNTEHRLPEVHARLMAQNISLHSLLEKAQSEQDASATPPTRQRDHAHHHTEPTCTSERTDFEDVEQS